MRQRQQFLGRMVPDDGWMHRLRPGWKLGGVAALSVVVLLFRDAGVNAVLLAVVLLAAVTARVPLRSALAPLLRIWFVFAAVALIHLVLTDWETGLRVASTIAVCLLAASLLMLTTSVAQLLTVFRTLAAPLRWVGADPERVGLAAALMVRSLPVVADLARVSGDSARARGLERNLRARTVPLVLGAVKHAQDTGRALEARGLE